MRVTPALVTTREKRYKISAKRCLGEADSMGKYTNFCAKMFLKSDNPPIPGKSPVLMCGRDHFEGSAHWVEITTVTGNFMMMQGTPKDAEKIVHVGPDGHKGGPYPKYILNADRMIFFYGTDTNNLNDLGAHVEFHLGTGEGEEVFEFDEPRSVFVPQGVRYGPIYITEFRRNLIIFDVLEAPTRGAAGIVTDFDYLADEEKIKRV